MSIAAGMPDAIIPFKISQADLIANAVEDLVAPIDGYLEYVRTNINKAITTGGTLTIKTGVAQTTVPGLTQTIANAATKGTIQLSTATKQSTLRKVARGDRITITPAGFATAGEITGYLHFQAADLDTVMPY